MVTMLHNELSRNGASNPRAGHS